MSKKIIVALCIISMFLMFCTVYSADSNLDTILNNVESRYTQETFNDPQTGLEITYNIYLPDNYDTSKKYPLVVFIADSSLAGKQATSSLEQGYGGVIWANDTQNECIILVPTYGEVIIDDMNGYVKTDYLNATKNLIDNISSTHSVDANKIYGTGQSMGGMTMLYLASTYPDLFAAELFVSCQWDINELDKLDSQKFIYIVSNGDDKASTGQKEVMEMLDSKNVKYGTLEDLDAQSNDNDNKVNEMLNQNNNINFISFKSGTVTSDSSDNPMGSSEHMSSFDYAYKLDSVRNWLFKQQK
ncbi:carboxylesterase family protein [Methanobrevibacter sp.]